MSHSLVAHLKPLKPHKGEQDVSGLQRENTSILDNCEIKLKMTSSKRKVQMYEIYTKTTYQCSSKIDQLSSTEKERKGENEIHRERKPLGMVKE